MLHQPWQKKKPLRGSKVLVYLLVTFRSSHFNFCYGYKTIREWDDDEKSEEKLSFFLYHRSGGEREGGRKEKFCDKKVSEREKT